MLINYYDFNCKSAITTLIAIPLMVERCAVVMCVLRYWFNFNPDPGESGAQYPFGSACKRFLYGQYNFCYSAI